MLEITPPVLLSQILVGCRVVVTRPEPQATKTVDALMAAGAEALAFPLIQITAMSVTTVANQCRPLLNAITTPTKVIYVSAAAAQYGVPIIRRLTSFSPFARHIAIGTATANKLTKLGETCLFVPSQDEDSESLLADPILQNIAGQTIVIMKGASDAGGRTLLADTLVTRGAMVVGIICYQRAPVVMSLKRRQALRWAIQHATHVIAGSVETLDALEENGDGLVKRVAHLLVPHARIAAVAKKRGVKMVSVVSLEDNKLIDNLNKLMA